MLPAPWGLNLQSPEHQSDVHPTKPQRPAAYIGTQLMTSKRYADVNFTVNCYYFDLYPHPRYDTEETLTQS